MNILRLKQFLLSRAAPTHWKDDSESIQLSAELMDVQMAAAPDFGSEESVGVGYSLEFFGFAQQPPTGSSESLNVGYSIDAFEFKRHPDLSSQESLGVGYAIEDFVFKEMPTTQSEESLGVGYSIEAFEFKRPSWTLDGDGMPLEAYALLMHMDGNAGGISLDHGFYARPVTRVSTAQLVTTDKQFGTASMQGVSLGGFSVPETATLQMRAGAFQCDWRMKITAVNALTHVISNLNTAYGRPYEWSIGYLNDAIHFYYGTRGSNQAHIKLKLPGGVTFTSLLNQWVSVSLARNSNGKWGAWLNGVPTTQYQVSVLQGGVNYGAVTTGDYVNATDFGAGYTDEVIAVGAAIIPGHDNLNVSGLLDEVRYLVGTCREIGAAYTPMAVPFANASSGGGVIEPDLDYGMTILDTPFDIVTSDKPTDYAGSTWAAGTTVLLVNDPVLGAPNKCWDRLTNTSSFKGYLRYDYVYTPVAGPLRIEIDLYPTARASAGVTSEILTIAGRTSAGHNQSEGDLVVDENGHVVWKLYGTPGSSPYYDQSPVLTLLGAATLPLNAWSTVVVECVHADQWRIIVNGVTDAVGTCSAAPEYSSQSFGTRQVIVGGERNSLYGNTVTFTGYLKNLKIKRPVGWTPPPVVDAQYAYRQLVLDNAPIAYWPLSDVGAGNQIEDISGNGNHATMNGSEYYVASPIHRANNRSIGFAVMNTSSNTRARIPAASLDDRLKKLAISNRSFTILTWYYRTDTTTYNHLLAGWQSGYYGDSAYRIIYNTSLQSKENSNNIGLPNIGLNNVGFIAWTKDGSNGYRAFQNGVWYTPDTAYATHTTEVTEALEFPAVGNWNYYGLRGYMSDLAIYDKVLSDIDILKLYDLGLNGGDGEVDYGYHWSTVCNYNLTEATTPSNLEMFRLAMSRSLLIANTAKIRLTLKAGSGGAIISGLYVGAQNTASGVYYNCTGDMVPITVNGSTSFSVPGNGYVVTDPIDISTLPGNLVFSWYISSPSATSWATIGGSTWKLWYKFGIDEAATAVVSGYTVNNGNPAFFIQRVECLTPP